MGATRHSGHGQQLLRLTQVMLDRQLLALTGSVTQRKSPRTTQQQALCSRCTGVHVLGPSSFLPMHATPSLTSRSCSLVTARDRPCRYCLPADPVAGRWLSQGPHRWCCSLRHPTPRDTLQHKQGHTHIYTDTHARRWQETRLVCVSLSALAAGSTDGAASH